MPSRSKPPLEPGQRFRGLLIQSVLGEGAMGFAFLASHPILRIPLVVKTFKDAANINVFSEAHLCARVASPHVVAVMDAGVEGEMPFVVQRYVDGIDLDELVDRAGATGRPLPIGMVARLVADAARGLHAIHQAGVVHRDVKPANLFLAGSGETVLGDFGIAIDRGFVDGEELAGTPTFMAPEQWANEEMDRRTDVYALGVAAHYTATGNCPFVADTVANIAMAHLTQEYSPPPAREAAEAYFYAALARMLRKDREERYPTADAVARTLDVIAEPPPHYVLVSQDAAMLGRLRVSLEGGDIALVEADAIVNAANWRLTMDAGVAAALRKRGGPELETDARARAPVQMGSVVWTGAGTLKARYVAHAVAALSGSICVQRCVLRAMFGAEARGLRTIALPALGTGIGGVPMGLGAKLTLEALKTFAATRPRSLEEVRIVLYDANAVTRWREVLRSI